MSTEQRKKIAKQLILDTFSKHYGFKLLEYYAEQPGSNKMFCRAEKTTSEGFHVVEGETEQQLWKSIQPEINRIMSEPGMIIENQVTKEISGEGGSHWKEPAVPRHVLQMFVWDLNSKILFMHRSNKVKSARNVWSIPTGTHEIGETAQDCIVRELYEEFQLDAQHIVLVDQYENIAGDEAPPHYHWVLSIYAVLVKDVTVAVNKEPELHDQMKFVQASDISQEFFEEHQFHKSLHPTISSSIHDWHSTAHTRALPYLEYVKAEGELPNAEPSSTVTWKPEE